MVIRNGALSVSDDSAPQSPPLTLRDIHLTMTPAERRSRRPSSPAPGRRCASTERSAARRPSASRSTPPPPGRMRRDTATFVVEQFQVNAALLDMGAAEAAARWCSRRGSARRSTGKVTLAWANCRDAARRAGGPRAQRRPRRRPAAAGAAHRTDAAALCVDGAAAGSDRPARQVRRGHGRRVAQSQRLGSAGAVRHVGTGRQRHARPTAVRLAAALQRRRPRVAGVLCEQWDQFQPAGVVDATLQATFDGADVDADRDAHRPAVVVRVGQVPVPTRPTARARFAARRPPSWRRRCRDSTSRPAPGAAAGSRCTSWGR